MENIKLPLYDVVNKLFFGFLFILYLVYRFPCKLSLLQFKLFPDTILTGIWISFIYFLGYCINRIGSVVIETICRKIRLFYWESYEKYCKVSDNKQVQIINREYANSRTFCSLFLILIIIELYNSHYDYIYYLIFFLCLFVISARKHTKKMKTLINKGNN